MAEKIFWFRHDTGTLSDLKMQRIMRLHGGMMGIGMYWTLVELLHINDGKIMFEEVADLAYSMRVSEDQLMALASDDQVFESDGDGFWSNRVNAQLEAQRTASEKARKSIEARWNQDRKQQKARAKKLMGVDADKAEKEAIIEKLQYDCNTNVTPSQYDRNTTVVPSNNDRNTEEKRREEKREDNTCNEYIASPELQSDDADSAPSSPVFITLPCVGSPSRPNQSHPVTEADVEMYEKLYPALDVRQELREMYGWLDANPKRRKKNTRSFITNWLGRSTDRARVPDNRGDRPEQPTVPRSSIRPGASRAPIEADQGPVVTVHTI